MPPAIQTRQIGVWQMQIYIKFINYGRIWLFISPVLSLLGENPALYLPLPMGSTLPFGNTRYFFHPLLKNKQNHIYNFIMDIILEPKPTVDAYSTPIIQQTSFWSMVKERLGMHSCAFEFKVRNRYIYDGVGGYSTTNADPSHPMYGLYKFKQVFGGDIFHQLGCWDYPIDNGEYQYLAACEMNMTGYYVG